jgi:SMODS-associating 2TM, beta-strand rich effector domain
LAPLPFAFLLAALFWKPVWRLVWRLPFLGDLLADRIFPDLNGHWDVEMQSNWPTLDSAHEASSGKSLPRFDADKLVAPALLQVEGLVAHIDQSWLGLQMKMKSENPLSKIESSTTIAFDFIRRTRDEPHKLAYVYDQDTKPENRAAGDEDGFLGAAMLSVSDDANTLTGLYFSNRNWLRGKNTAGKLTLKRRLG